MPPVVVETNWVLDVTLHQNEASEDLLRFARAGHVELLLPSFCIAEAVKNFESKQNRWKTLEDAISREKEEALRGELLQFVDGPLTVAANTLAELADQAETEFWDRLAEITGVAKVVEPTPAVIHRTMEIRQLLGLDPADAAVLATVVEMRLQGIADVFVSRDTDFGDEPVRAYIADQNITYHGSALPITGPLTGAHGPSRQL